MTSTSLIFTLALSICLVSAFLIQYYLNEHAKERYIDEYFHLKMTEQYFVQGNYKDWDPQITTPPGLYYIAVVFGYIVRGVFGLEMKGEEEVNTTMRYLNSVVIGTLNMLILYKIFKFKFQNKDEAKSKDDSKK